MSTFACRSRAFHSPQVQQELGHTELLHACLTRTPAQPDRPLVRIPVGVRSGGFGGFRWLASKRCSFHPSPQARPTHRGKGYHAHIANGHGRRRRRVCHGLFRILSAIHSKYFSRQEQEQSAGGALSLLLGNHRPRRLATPPKSRGSSSSLSLNADGGRCQLDQVVVRPQQPAAATGTTGPRQSSIDSCFNHPPVLAPHRRIFKPFLPLRCRSFSLDMFASRFQSLF